MEFVLFLMFGIYKWNKEQQTQIGSVSTSVKFTTETDDSSEFLNPLNEAVGGFIKDKSGELNEEYKVSGQYVMPLSQSVVKL